MDDYTDGYQSFRCTRWYFYFSDFSQVLSSATIEKTSVTRTPPFAGSENSVKLEKMGDVKSMI